ncbi:hypothetical protein Dsin_025888 [Dipteronia sinensis]|uniref:Aluminum-activated malate transporter n=1 Tax=Dipteronia sinensis TaxID=43782 RepID=A0AAD9ZYA7_9ROSI|nr:hypothetical protein Dsin_025888 [Dipteronia sinensis]
MAIAKQVSSNLEWRVKVPDGTSEKLVPESGQVLKLWLRLKGLLEGMILKIYKFLYKAWKLAVAEPKKVIHGIKVGLAISLVSLFYYMRPLYESVGGNAMWAIMTVVVVFESTIGATFCKCINRTIGTTLAGSLGVGVHWIASHSSKDMEPIIIGASVFVLVSAATFSRFMPSIKARFDYVSGYRVDKLFEMAHHRVSTIAIGTSLCIIVSMVVCPIWAGGELHQLICLNLEKLAYSLDECVAEYFKDKKTSSSAAAIEEDCRKKMLGYKCVLNTKGIEESMAMFARWEPAHGRFNFRHPWKQYLKIGASMRNCAYCIETLNGCVNSKIQAPIHLKRHLKRICLRLSTSSSNVLQELASNMKMMKKSSKIELLVGEMSFAVEELQNAMKSIPNHLIITTTSSSEAHPVEANTEPMTKITATPPFMEILPLATIVSMLIQKCSQN